MTIPPQGPSPDTRRRKPLNVTAIKSAIVFGTGLFTAALSALTGVGAQVLYAPMLTWMLGFGEEKALGTAMRYAFFSALALCAGAIGFHVVPGSLFLPGLVLFLGATVGAIVAVPLSPKQDRIALRRLFATIGVALMLAVIVDTTHLSIWNTPHREKWHLPQLALLGLAAGALTQGLSFPGGVLMVVGLHFLAGFTAIESVVLSLFVIALAAVLPAWSYGKRGLVDTRYGNAAILGGILGGGLGSLLLTRVTDKAVLLLFGVSSMFLFARELARLAVGSREVQG